MSWSGTDANGESYVASISTDGRFVAFPSVASNLVAGDTNWTTDVFVRDRQIGATERASVSSSGTQADSHSGLASISADGRFVAFESYASNLVAGDTNGVGDIFVRDRQIGTTERVSVSTSGAQTDSESRIGTASISADGRFVAFSCRSGNLVAGDMNGHWDVFVHDRQIGTTERVSVSASGADGNWSSSVASVSSDGRCVAFASGASNLVAGDMNGHWDVFVHDRLLGTTERMSVTSTGLEGNADSVFPSITADGRFVAFPSNASNLVGGDTNGTYDVFVRDRQIGTTERVSVSTSGTQADSSSMWASISADGREVAFESYASNLVAGDTNALDDVFVRDRQLGTTERVSVSSSGVQGDNNSDQLAISADGRYVAFHSWAGNLVAGDMNTVPDIFVRDRALPGVAFCSGDGTGTACPCGNAGPAGAGCLNSLGTGGSLAASGGASLSMDTVVLTGAGMPDSSALYFQGTSRANGGLGTTFGDGLRCAAGSVIRLGTKVNVSGASRYPEAADQPLSVRGAITAPGTRDYQTWYRNAAAFCQPEGFNLTNGWEITWEL